VVLNNGGKNSRRICTLACAGYIRAEYMQNSGHLSADRWRTHFARTKIVAT
jgi:hypothetical protein